MTDTNQKLREAFSRIRSLITDTTRIDSHTISLVRVECDQALALPTAEQVDDINVAESFTSVTKTAAPVGEREEFEAWLGITPCGAAHDFGWAAWQARAALSAGDSVDAQRYRLVRRGQHFSVINGIGDTLRGEALDAAADAAMRKGQL